MSRISKFVKVDKNILIEYVYNDGNLLSEGYNILVNSRDRTKSYMAIDSSSTGNDAGNQLFKIDNVNLKYGKIDTANYSFLQIKNFTSGVPLRHDTIKIHLPINWTFGEYLGCYVKVYTFDQQNFKTYDLTNFYFDMTDVSQQYLLNYNSPPLLFQEKLWGKYIKLEIPAISEVSSQLTGTRPRENSLNANLTDGSGLSITTPIFLDFQFIDNIQTINAITTYRLTAKVSTSFSQTPEFEKLGLMIKHSSNGDFFEVYGMYNDSLAGFNQFIEDSFIQGNRYYVQYSITLYEQNIRGKTLTITVQDNFNETIEYRPIIKTSTTTAIIDVEMRLIDAVDESYIIRKASYGMLQDEVAKYSLKLMKINLKNAMKPKIYAIKNAIDPSMLGLANAQGRVTKGSGLLNSLGIYNQPPSPTTMNAGGVAGTDVLASGSGGGFAGQGIGTGVGGAIGGGSNNMQTVKVPFPVLVDKNNIIGKSESALFNSKIFYGNTRMQITIYPFDNIIAFSIATGDVNAPTFLDMTNYGEIKLVFRNNTENVEFTLYTESPEIDLQRGQIVFKVTQNKFAAIKKIFDAGINLFYITSLNRGTTTVVYTGLFKIIDTKQNVQELNTQAAATSPSIIKDPSLARETAIVTRQLISNKPPSKGTNK